MNKRAIVLMLFAAWAVGVSAAEERVTQEAPVVIWVSSPVQPGETVLIHGGNFGEKPVVELTSGWRKQTVTPISISDAAMMFVYPASWKPGIVSGVVKAGSLVGKPFQINAPDAWWVQGDRGREASTKSGNVSIFGNCLSGPGKAAPKVSLRSIDGGKKGRTYSTDIAKFNRFSVRTAGWGEIPAGLYEVVLHRDGKGEEVVAGQVRVSAAKNEVPAAIFNVVDFGAVPSDGIDDTVAILAAVRKLTENGGGTLLFPRGRFQMTEAIELPPHSVLRGGGADYSQVYWPDSYEPLEALVRGTHSFTVSDIFLTCGNHKDGIVGNWPEPMKQLTPEEKAVYKCGNITISNITLRMLYSQFINSDMDELKRRLPPIHGARALHFGGENIKITGNDIYCAAGGVFELRAYWSEVSNNSFCRGNIIGWNGFGGQQLIVADNHLGGANCTSFYGLPEGSENIYWGNNFHENNFDGNNRETITGDLRVHAYMDTVDNISPTAFSLRSESSWRYGVDAWKKGAVQIAGGKGAGQIRRIKSIDGAKIELESAWDIVPDEKSVISISSFRRRFIYTENKAYDSSVALQFYGSMIEGIVANNETARTGGYNGDAMAGEANWFNQFLGNTIQTGNAYRGPRNEVPPLDAQLGLLANGNGIGDHKYPLVRSCVIRHNELKSCAKLNVQGWVVDSILENNSVEHADAGVTVSDVASNIVMRLNRFADVGVPYDYNRQSVIIRPAEEFSAAMCGVSALTGWRSSEDLPADATPEQVDAARARAIRAFVKQNGDKPVSGTIAEALLGIRVESPNWQTAYSTVREGKAGSSPLFVRVSGSRVKVHLKLSCLPEEFPFEGWSFAVPEADLVAGTNVDLTLTITKPEGKARMLRIPLRGELYGDGWKLAFTTTVADAWDSITLDKFKVSQPFENPLGKETRIGYIKYAQIPGQARANLVDGPMEHGRFGFASMYQDAVSEGKIIYGITTLKTKSPVKVKFQFSDNCLFFVNGKSVGTTLGRGQWGFVCLVEGENKVEMLMLPSKKDEWRFGLPRITWAEKVMALE